jgi:DNA invertase Pin-like site-specific DNA recombinase
MKIVLDARLSTDGQDPEVQLEAQRAHATSRGWTIVDEYLDHGYSGAKEKRPASDRFMRAAWTGNVQAVLVWRFDRVAPSVKHLITALEPFRSLNITFISVPEQIDTSTSIGQAIHHDWRDDSTGARHHP